MARQSGVAFPLYKQDFGGKKTEDPGCSFRAFATFPFQLLGHIRLAVVPLDSSAGCILALESSSSLMGPSPQDFTHFGGCWVYCLALLIRGMLTGLKVYLALQDVCGLRLYDHLKTALCHIRALLGCMINV